MDWTFSFGEETNTASHIYFLINRVLLFKGNADWYYINSPQDPFHSESQDTGCQVELIDTIEAVCLQCSLPVFALEEGKMVCLPATPSDKSYGPAKTGAMSASLRVFCPEGQTMIPSLATGTCTPCTNPLCSRCSSLNLNECLGCKTTTFLRLDGAGSCTASPCPVGQYLSIGEGQKCLSFPAALQIPNCLATDAYGWCDRSTGCAAGETYQLGLCCLSSATRDASTYPGRCFRCNSTCSYCTGTASNQCTTCPTGRFLNAQNQCVSCPQSGCIKCDLVACEVAGENLSTGVCPGGPGIFDNTSSTPNTCVKCADFCTTCSAENQCSACMNGYFLHLGRCYRCREGCDWCNSSSTSDCVSCKADFTVALPNCPCAGLMNIRVSPNVCSLTCPPNCAFCAAGDVCQQCDNEFILSGNTCTCATSGGFTITNPTTCDRCSKGCVSCAGGVNDCSACRSGFQDFPSCICKTNEGWREDQWKLNGVATRCMACTDSTCHSCDVDLAVCSGCRANYALVAGGCVCHVGRGFRQDLLAMPQTCSPCTNPSCHSCANDVNICTSCRTNYEMIAGACVCQVSRGYREDLTATPKTCTPCTNTSCHSCDTNVNVCSDCRQDYMMIAGACVCLVTNRYTENLVATPKTCAPCTNTNCHSCTNDVNVCTGCRANYLLQSGACVCTVANGFYLVAGLGTDQQGNTYDTTQCLQCSANCLTCNNAPAASCTSCRVGFSNTSGFPGTCDAVVTPATQTPLRFQVQKKSSEQGQLFFQQENNLFEITLSHDLGTALATDFIPLNIFDLKLFLITPADAVQDYAFTNTEPLKLTVTINFAPESISQQITLNFTPDPTKFTSLFRIEGGAQSLSVFPAPKINQVALEDSKDKGGTIGELNQYSGYGSNVGTVALAFLNMDLSGLLMRMSQMNKLFCRLRFLNANYGAYLWSYFNWSSLKFDPSSKLPRRELLQKSNKYYGNFFLMNVALDVFEGFTLETYIYTISWLLKVISSLMLMVSIGSQKVSKWQCYFISICQKIHLLSFNILALDLLPYGLITIFHTRNYDSVRLYWSVGLMVLLLVDFCQIWELGGRAVMRESKVAQNHASSLLSKSDIVNSPEAARVSKAPQKIGANASEPQSKVTSETLKVLDEQAMIAKLKANQAIVSFCIDTLKSENQFSKQRFVLMSNFSFLIRLSLMQLVLVGLAMLPKTALIILILIELVYSTSMVRIYSKYRHLKSFLLIIPKVGQSVALVLIELLILLSCYDLAGGSQFHFPESRQRLIISVIYYSNLTEYVFIAIHLFTILSGLYTERKRKQADPEYKQYSEMKDTFLIYRDPNTGVQKRMDQPGDVRPAQLQASSLGNNPFEFRRESSKNKVHPQPEMGSEFKIEHNNLRKKATESRLALSPEKLNQKLSKKLANRIQELKQIKEERARRPKPSEDEIEIKEKEINISVNNSPKQTAKRPQSLKKSKFRAKYSKKGNQQGFAKLQKQELFQT